jgi:hypothetical protein
MLWSDIVEDEEFEIQVNNEVKQSNNVNQSNNNLLTENVIYINDFKNSEAELTPNGIFKNATRRDSAGIFKNESETLREPTGFFKNCKFYELPTLNKNTTRSKSLGIFKNESETRWEAGDIFNNINIHNLKSYNFNNIYNLKNFLYRFKKNGILIHFKKSQSDNFTEGVFKNSETELTPNGVFKILKPNNYSLNEFYEVINSDNEFYNSFINIITKIYINKFVKKNNKYIKSNTYNFIKLLHKLFINNKKNNLIINENICSQEFNKLNIDSKLQIIGEIYNYK